MCRLGFISACRQKDLTKFLMLGTTWYSSDNSDGVGYAVSDGKKITLKKYGGSAVPFWLNHAGDVTGKAAIFHVRKATNGKVSDANAHPFISEDGALAVVHNGIIHDYDKVKGALILAGHKFSSDTDSEVFLHAYKEWGNEFISKLIKAGVGGLATVLILKATGEVVLYTNNNSIEVYGCKTKCVVGVSDKTFISGKEIAVESDTLYTLENGSFISEVPMPMMSLYRAYNESAWRDWGYSYKAKGAMARLDYNKGKRNRKANKKLMLSSFNEDDYYREELSNEERLELQRCGLF